MLRVRRAALFIVLNWFFTHASSQAWIISETSSHRAYYFSNLLDNSLELEDYAHYHSLDLSIENQRFLLLFRPDFFGFKKNSHLNNIQTELECQSILFQNKINQLKLSGDFSFLNYYQLKEINFNSKDFSLSLQYTAQVKPKKSLSILLFFSKQYYDKIEEWDNQQFKFSCPWRIADPHYTFTIKPALKIKKYMKSDFIQNQVRRRANKKQDKSTELLSLDLLFTVYLPHNLESQTTFNSRLINNKAPLWQREQNTFSFQQKWDDEFASSGFNLSQKISHLNYQLRELSFRLEYGEKNYGRFNPTPFKGPHKIYPKRNDRYFIISGEWGQRKVILKKEFLFHGSIEYKNNESNDLFFDFSGFHTSFGFTIYY